MKPGAGKRLVFFDLESGGLDGRCHPLTELGALAVCADTLEILEEFHFRVSFDPQECDPKSLSINKYDPTLWALTAQPPEVVAGYFADFLRRHATLTLGKKNGSGPFQVAQLVAHNADGFDAKFLLTWYERLGLYFPGGRAMLCTKQRAMWLFNENSSLARPKDMKLGTLAEYIGIETRPDHTALNDAKAMLEIYKLTSKLMLDITESQQLYLDVLTQRTGLSWRKLLNRAINSIVSEIFDQAA